MSVQDRPSPRPVARNAPCPCGSGLRYKHCHGRLEAGTGAPAAAVAPTAASSDIERLRRGVSVLGTGDAAMRALKAESVERHGCYREALSSLETYCLFIGYPRSGHSLIGALLDAHPDMVVAHELDVLAFMEAGFTRREIEYLLIENARRSGAAGRAWNEFDYGVPGGWQGRFRRLKVLGDKKGGLTTRMIAERPTRLDALLDFFGGRIRFLHVARNPFDLIATSFRKTANDLATTAEGFFALARTNARIRDRLGPGRVLDLWHEDTVARPEDTLRRLCAFFRVDPEPHYLTACAAVIQPAPRRSRDGVDWTPELIERIGRDLRGFDFLAHYRFDG